MPYAVYHSRVMGVFVENSLHWIMAKKLDGKHPFLIVAFNEVPLPAEIGGEVVNSSRSFDLEVAVLGGCLCVIVNYDKLLKLMFG